MTAKCKGCGGEFYSRDGAVLCYQCAAATRLAEEADDAYLRAQDDLGMISVRELLDALNHDGTFTLPDGRRFGQFVGPGGPFWGEWPQ